MRQPKTFLLLSVVVAVLVLGVAYAAISNINFEITGTAKVDPSQANFDVRFDSIGSQSNGNSNYTGSGNVTVIPSISTDKKTATMNTSGFSAKGDYGYVEFMVINNSTDLAANISVTNSLTGDSKYFNVNAYADKTYLAPGEFTSVHVTVTLNQTLISEEPTATVKVTVTASPAYAS